MGFAKDELDYRAEQLALEKQRAEEEYTDAARAIVAPLMVLLEYMAERDLKLRVGDMEVSDGTDPDDVIANLVDLLGVEPSKRHQRAMREWTQAITLHALSPAGQA